MTNRLNQWQMALKHPNQTNTSLILNSFNTNTNTLSVMKDLLSCDITWVMLNHWNFVSNLKTVTKLVTSCWCKKWAWKWVSWCTIKNSAWSKQYLSTHQKYWIKPKMAILSLNLMAVSILNAFQQIQVHVSIKSRFKILPRLIS